MTDPIIYGTESSPFVRKVLVTLSEKGIGWTLEAVNVFDPPDWFPAISPARRIPVLRMGEDTIADSSAICGYLEKAHPTPALYPEDPMDYGRALWFEEYADTLLAARIGFGLLRTLVVAPMQGQPADVERARKALREDLPPLFDYLEQQLEGRSYAVGDRFSIADISLATQLAGLHVTRVQLDAARWPGLVRYAKAMLARDSFKVRLEAVAELRPDVPYDL